MADCAQQQEEESPHPVGINDRFEEMHNNDQIHQCSTKGGFIWARSIQKVAIDNAESIQNELP